MIISVFFGPQPVYKTTVFSVRRPMFFWPWLGHISHFNQVINWSVIEGIFLTLHSPLLEPQIIGCFSSSIINSSPRTPVITESLLIFTFRYSQANWQMKYSSRCKNFTLRNICSLEYRKKADNAEVQPSHYKQEFTQKPEFQSSPFYYSAPSQVVCAFVSMIYPSTATGVHSSVLQMSYTLLGNRDTQIKRHGSYPKGDRPQKQVSRN